MENKFSQKIAKLDREVLNLKTAQKIPSSIKAASYTFSVEASGGGVYQNGIYQYRINYDDGIQPILSEYYYEGRVWAQEPSGNTQDLFIRAEINDAPCTIVSTRPIISAQKIA